MRARNSLALALVSAAPCDRKKVYEVGTAPPGGRHEVRHDGAFIRAFVLDPEETRVMDLKKGVTETLLVDIADRFVAQGGAPMGIA